MNHKDDDFDESSGNSRERANILNRMTRLRYLDLTNSDYNGAD